jgi:DNA-binding transcriptional ArsR family regulator
MDTINTLFTEVNQLHADLCSALADPTRILVLYLLADGPCTVNELTGKLGVPQPTTSRHLKILRDRGLVQGSRRGQVVEYSLRDRRLIDALDILRAVLRDSIAYRASLITIE